MKKCVYYVGTVFVSLLLLSGCSSKQLPLQKHFQYIRVGQSKAAEVLNLLGDENLLHTAGSVSILREKGWAKELGMIHFHETDSRVDRKNYLQITSSIVPPFFVHEKLYLLIQTVVPEDVLSQPYENDMRKNAAILHYCQEAMIDDSRDFKEDKVTVSYMGLARSALGMAIQEFAERPRESAELTGQEGFLFTHFNLGKCRLRLRQDMENIYTTTLVAGDIVDPFGTW